MLGEGEAGKWTIIAHSASASAIAKVQKAGGSITVKSEEVK